MLEITEQGRATPPCGCARQHEHAPVAAAAVAVLDQCAELVRCATDRAYAADSVVLKGGTIGKHIRHTLDHFRAALDGLATGGIVDYDRRERNVPMETDRDAALEAIGLLRGRLSRLSIEDFGRQVRVRVMLTCDGQEAELRSTFARELAFATHHAVHHHAMLAAIAAELGLPLCSGFGKAPSTQRHERSMS